MGRRIETIEMSEQEIAAWNEALIQETGIRLTGGEYKVDLVINDKPLQGILSSNGTSGLEFGNGSLEIPLVRPDEKIPALEIEMARHNSQVLSRLDDTAWPEDLSHDFNEEVNGFRLTYGGGGQTFKSLYISRRSNFIESIPKTASSTQARLLGLKDFTSELKIAFPDIIVQPSKVR